MNQPRPTEHTDEDSWAPLMPPHGYFPRNNGAEASGSNDVMAKKEVGRMNEGGLVARILYLYPINKDPVCFTQWVMVSCGDS